MKCPNCDPQVEMGEQEIILCEEMFMEWSCPKCNKTFQLVDKQYLNKLRNKK